MKRKNRKIIVYTLFGIFLVAAPTVLLFASGYRYNWHKHRIEKTGIIFVETSPAGAQVTVDGKVVRNATPVSVPNLMPEEYRVTLEKSGYLPWSKNLRVESGQTTFAKGVILLRDEVPRLIKAADITVGDFSADGTGVAYLETVEEWEELSFHDIRTGETLLLARFAGGKYVEPAIELSADGTYLLFRGRATDGNSRSAILYPVKVAARGTDLVLDRRGTDGLSVAWSLDGSSLVAFGETGAFNVDKTRGTIDPLPADRGIRDAFRANDFVWLIRASGNGDILEKIRPDGRSPAEGPITLPRTGFRFVGGNGRYLILSDGRAGGGLAVDTQSGAFKEMPHTTGLEWESPDRTGRLLLWNDFEVFVTDPAKPGAALITRIGTGVGECGWHPKSRYIFYSDNNGITAVEMDGRDRRNTYRLVGFDSVGPIVIDREAGVLRFVGTIGNQRGIFERPL